MMLHWVFISFCGLEHISDLFLVFLLLALSMCLFLELLLYSCIQFIYVNIQTRMTHTKCFHIATCNIMLMISMSSDLNWHALTTTSFMTTSRFHNFSKYFAPSHWLKPYSQQFIFNYLFSYLRSPQLINLSKR